ncbi:uncharacterized protein LOC144094138 [Amblyomma americanum]
MTTDSAPPSAPATPTVVVAHPRDPGTFCGTDGVDVEDWLSLYERISQHNRWDATLMLANVIFYLAGTARVWFETHEEEIATWDACKQKLRGLFGKPVGRQLAAKKELAARAQTATESYITYIQDVLALCRKVDPNMTEDDKVGHIPKGIADDAFHLLLCRDCSTVDSVLQVCRRFEQAKHRRIAHRFDRLPNTAARSTCEDLPTLRQPSNPDHVTRIVRRELEALAPVTPNAPLSANTLATISLIQAVVRQEVANLGMPSSHRPVEPRSARPISPVVATATARNTFVPSYTRYRNPDEWRTPDDRPICFTCSRVGHISRHCRSRWSAPPRPLPFVDRRYDYGPRRFTPRNDPPSAESTPPSRRTSRSPSQTAHRSRSPLPHRSYSPSSAGRFAGN